MIVRNTHRSAPRSIDTPHREGSLETRLRQLIVIERDLLPVMDPKEVLNATTYFLQLVNQYGARSDDVLHLLSYAATKGRRTLLEVSKDLNALYFENPPFTSELPESSSHPKRSAPYTLQYWLFEMHAALAKLPDASPPISTTKEFISSATER
jgi:hypothetical protein